MSIADLKMRLADVPGIETLSMALEAGRISLRWGPNYSTSVDAAASDSDIEAATCRDFCANPSPSQAGPGLSRRGYVPRRLRWPRLGQNPFVRQDDGSPGDDVG